MSREPAPTEESGLTRRRLLLGGAALAAAAGTAGAIVAEGDRGARALEPVALGTQPSGLPDRQFAWDAVLSRDRHGNAVPPRHNRLLFFDVVGEPSAAHATRLEAALRTLERAYRWSPDGLLFSVGWGHHYFARTLGERSPIPPAQSLSDFEQPTIDDFDMVLQLATDQEQRLDVVEHALARGSAVGGADGTTDLRSVLRLRDVRTGFVGEGLPAANQDTQGIPAGGPVPASAPLFMGFKSSLKRNQATEDAITIASGEFARGTTMAVSYMRLSLDSWYQDLDEAQRVQRMYAPQMTPKDVDRVTTDAAGDPGGYQQAVTKYGVVGHAQTSARARRRGKPLILRRDFDTVDGGKAGVHFVSLQRTIEDFVITRTAMNATGAGLQNPSISETTNNGINEFIFVLRRGYYVVPARANRSFPLVAQRD